MPSCSDILDRDGLDAPNPHRPDTKSAERFERVRAALRDRTLKRIALEHTRDRAAAALARRLPAAFGDWGVVRTRAWKATSEALRRAAARQGVTALELGAAIDAFESVETISIEACARLINDIG